MKDLIFRLTNETVMYDWRYLVVDQPHSLVRNQLVERYSRLERLKGVSV